MLSCVNCRKSSTTSPLTWPPEEYTEDGMATAIAWVEGDMVACEWSKSPWQESTGSCTTGIRNSGDKGVSRWLRL